MNTATLRRMLLGTGDVNAFFALFVDNTVNLVILVGLLVSVFGFPARFALTHMVPGTALGVLFGDLVYTWMAVSMARRTGRTDITAMPLGLDTPSTIGIATIVIGPVFAQTHDPAMAWYVGMAVMIVMGVFKTIVAFFGDAVTRIVPRPGLLGPLGGIGLALLAFIPVMKVFDAPIAGMVGLGIVLYGLIAGRRLPLGIPAALGAVLASLVVYWLAAAAGLHPVTLPTMHVHLALPMPTLGFIHAGHRIWDFLPVALPFGLLTIIGGINVTESARAAGDPYSTRSILLTEAMATLIAGLFGGVAQSTPYIGHPAYKAMGARGGYTLYTAIAIGIGGMTGLLQAVITLLPEVTVAPILLFVGIEIAVQSVAAVKREELSAVFFSMVPVLAYLVSIYGNQCLHASCSLGPSLSGPLHTASVIGRGFILTGMLWGSLVAYIIRAKKRAAIWTCVIMAGLTLFGLIHSFDPNGAAYLPWKVKDTMHPLSLAGGYMALAIVLFAMWGKGQKQ